MRCWKNTGSKIGGRYEVIAVGRGFDPVARNAEYGEILEILVKSWG
jgi:hypothetical protein